MLENNAQLCCIHGDTLWRSVELPVAESNKLFFLHVRPPQVFGSARWKPKSIGPIVATRTRYTGSKRRIFEPCSRIQGGLLTVCALTESMNRTFRPALVILRTLVCLMVVYE